MGMQDGIDRFHAHLDKCEQCRNQIFNLCPIGEQLLRQASVTGTSNAIAAWNTRKECHEQPADSAKGGSDARDNDE